MYSFFRWFLSGCLLPAALTLAGCAAPLVMSAGMTAAKAGAGTYVGRELRTARHVTIDEAWLASHRALDDLELEPETTVIRDRSRYVVAREPGGPRFRITVERKAPLATRIRIRVGFIGDVALSRLTMRRIDHHLAGIEPRTKLDEAEKANEDG